MQLLTVRFIQKCTVLIQTSSIHKMGLQFNSDDQFNQYAIAMIKLFSVSRKYSQKSLLNVGHEVLPAHNNTSQEIVPNLPLESFAHHFRYKSNANTCCIGCTWTDATNCTITNTCVYYDVYASSAKRCLPGCTFKKN